MQIQAASLEFQGEEVSLDPLTVQQQAILLKCLKINGNVVLQRAVPLLRERVDH